MLNSGLTGGFDSPAHQGIVMRISRSLATVAATGLALALAAPAAAHPDHDLPPPGAVIDAEGRDFADHPPMIHPEMDGAPHMPPPMADRGRWGEHWERMRGDWLEQCRERTGWRVAYHDDWRGNRHDDGLGGALIGGLAGGVIGNRVAGKGDRLVGTVIGAAAGAAVGVAIDKAEDRGHDHGYDRGYDDDRRGDYCEQYFDYYTQASHYGWGYAQPMMMVPVMAMSQGDRHGKECTETVVTEEWVTVPQRRRVIRDKRVRIVPDKRIPMK